MEIKTWKQDRFTSDLDSCREELNKIKRQFNDDITSLLNTARYNKNLPNMDLLILGNEIEESYQMLNAKPDPNCF